MKLEKYPKVLVGCPTSSHKEYCIEEYWERLKNLTYPNYDVLLVDNSKDDVYFEKLKKMNIPVIKSKYFDFAKDRIIFSRNIIRQKVIDGDYDYFLSLEQDVIPPRGLIERLLWRNKDVVSGLVFHLVPKVDKNGKKYLLQIPMLGRNVDNTDKISMFRTEQVLSSGSLVEIDYASMGCLLIKNNILDKIKFRYEEYGSDDVDNVIWDDFCFCRDARKLGYSLFADLGVRCKHQVLQGHTVSIGDALHIKNLKRIN